MTIKFRGTMLRRLLTVAWASAMPASLLAQTNDHLYRSWRWAPSVGSPRAAGLAGAFVAVADDSAATFLNPAGLATLPKSEIGGAAIAAPATDLGRDRAKAWSGIGYLAGAGRLHHRVAIGGYLTQVRGGGLELSDGFVLPDGSHVSGYLDAAIIEGGAAAAYKFAKGLNVGVRVTGTHLELEGLYRRTGDPGLIVESGTAAGHTRVTASLGVLYEAGEMIRLGVVVAPGASYSADRTANGPSGTLDAGSVYELRAPGFVTAGVAVRPSPRWLIAGQLDYVRYSEMKPFERPGTYGYETSDALEPRLGAEYSWPLGGVSLQIRAGVYAQAPGTFRFLGSDAIEATTFPGSSRRIVGSAGLTVATRAGLQVDLASAFGADQPVLLAGARFRF